MTRPPAFRLPPVNPIPLFLFFGHGDYVIARNAAEASVFWMDHFGEISYAREFEQIPGWEEIDIFVDIDERNCEIWVMEKEEAKSSKSGELRIWMARTIVERFPPGYLASTTED